MSRVLEADGAQVEVVEPDAQGDVAAYNDRVAELRRSGHEDVMADGAARTFHASGVPQIVRDEHGLESHYDDAGRLSARGRVEGEERVGPWQFYLPTGELRLVEAYGQDGVVGSTFFWPNGQVQARGGGRRSGAEFIRTGVWEHFRRDGSLQQRGTYGPALATIEQFDRGQLVETGTYVRGLGGYVRHGRFDGRDGVAVWDLGHLVTHEEAVADLPARVRRIASHERTPFLRELFHVEPEAFPSYLKLLCEGCPELPVADGTVLEGYGDPELAATEVARAVLGLPVARARHFLKTFAPPLGEALGSALVAAYGDGPGRSAVLRWLATAQPEGAEEVFLAALGDKSKSVRVLAAKTIASRDDATALWLRGLASSRAPAREAAAIGLRSASPDEATERLEFALRTEASAKVRTAIESTLGVFRLLGDSLGNAAFDLALQDRATTAWPYETALRFSDGTPLSTSALAWVGEALQRESPDVRDPELWALRARLRDDDCRALCSELGEDSERWTLFARAVLGDDAEMSALGRSLQDLVYLHSPAYAGHAVAALRRSQKPAALRWLSFWARKAATGKLKGDAEAAMEGLRTELALDADDLADLLVPTLGFDETGCRPLGGGFVAVWHSGGIDLDYDGDEVPPTPKKIERNLAKLRSNVPGARAAAFRQLELAMILDRSWPVDRWLGLFGRNPLLQPGLDQILCRMDEGPACLARDVRGAGRVRVLHRLDMTEQEARDGSHLRPPFPQVDRPVEHDPAARLRSLGADAEPVTGKIGRSFTFVVDGDGVRGEGRPLTEKILQEILVLCRSA